MGLDRNTERRTNTLVSCSVGPFVGSIVEIKVT